LGAGSSGAIRSHDPSGTIFSITHHSLGTTYQWLKETRRTDFETIAQGTAPGRSAMKSQRRTGAATTTSIVTAVRALA
jgi:hypothetical protein